VKQKYDYGQSEVIKGTAQYRVGVFVAKKGSV
jgi:hypothetical protein